MTKMYRTRYGASSTAPYEGAPYEISNEPTGEIRLSKGVDADFHVQDAKRTWSDGQIDIVKGYYKHVVAKEELMNHDICYYCGADNGERSQFRQGWDCWYCGGN